MKLLSLTIIIVAVTVVPAQSRRAVAAPTPVSPQVAAVAEQTVKQMYDEVAGYLRTKAAEFEQKKMPFSDSLLERTKLEQKQLAARYAAIAAKREVSGEDLYYLGLMHWLAVNLDGTALNLAKFLATPAMPADRSQTARSVLTVVLAKQGNVAEAEELLAVYLKSEPRKLTERARIEGELAKAYQTKRDFQKMAPHAVEDYAAAKALLNDPTSRARGLDEVLDAAMLVYEAYRDGGKQQLADAALDEMIAAAAETHSESFYYYAVDQKIKYMIETGRKPEAMRFYAEVDKLVAKDFGVGQATVALNARFKRRAKHYWLLGEPGPAFGAIDQWFPGQPKTIADYKGKVVLLDFWATWCVPCLEAFPHLKEWRQDFAADGFEILGLTRFYGTVNGLSADNASETNFLIGFRDRYQLPYDIAVTKGQEMQIIYGAMSLPTAVIIDRKGVVRYVESGTSPQRIEQMRQTIIKLLAEK